MSDLEQQCDEVQSLIDSTILEFIKVRKRLPTVIRISRSMFKVFEQAASDNPDMDVYVKKVYEGIPFVVDPDMDDDSVIVGDSH